MEDLLCGVFLFFAGVAVLNSAIAMSLVYILGLLGQAVSVICGLLSVDYSKYFRIAYGYYYDKMEDMMSGVFLFFAGIAVLNSAIAMPVWSILGFLGQAVSIVYGLFSVELFLPLAILLIRVPGWVYCIAMMVLVLVAPRVALVLCLAPILVLCRCIMRSWLWKSRYSILQWAVFGTIFFTIKVVAWGCWMMMEHALTARNRFTLLVCYATTAIRSRLIQTFSYDNGQVIQEPPTHLPLIKVCFGSYHGLKSIEIIFAGGDTE